MVAKAEPTSKFSAEANLPSAATEKETPAPSAESIGVYAHVPFCKHACPYCDFYKLELRARPARARLDFPQQLAAELDLLLAEYPQAASRKLATIYLGGGTPSTLVPEAVGQLVRTIRRRFASAPNPEITLEANPENLTAGRAAKWAAAGINRLSIGVQSFQPADLERLERLHQPATIADAVANARAAGFANISLDLMFALPGQSLDAWLENLKCALELQPEHLSFYGLTYHEGTPFAEWLAARQLQEVDEDLQAEMYLRGAVLLEDAGFEHYEISNFARPGFRSLHNQRYWTRADVLGLGPGAHSNYRDERWSNPEDLEGWAAAVGDRRLPRLPAEALPAEAAAEERLFTMLRRKEGLPAAIAPALYLACHKWRISDAPESERWSWISPEAFGLTREGWLISDGIIRRVLQFI